MCVVNRQAKSLFLRIIVVLKVTCLCSSVFWSASQGKQLAMPVALLLLSVCFGPPSPHPPHLPFPFKYPSVFLLILPFFSHFLSFTSHPPLLLTPPQSWPGCIVPAAVPPPLPAWSGTQPCPADGRSSLPPSPAEAPARWTGTHKYSVHNYKQSKGFSSFLTVADSYCYSYSYTLLLSCPVKVYGLGV